MVNFIILHLKNLLLYLFDIIHRGKKFAQLLLTGKHEFERICEDEACDIYEKTFKFDEWLTRTNCEKIRDFYERHLMIAYSKHSAAHRAIDMILINYIGHNNNGNKKSSKRNELSLKDADRILGRAAEDLSQNLIKLINRTKHRTRLLKQCNEILLDIVKRIITYRFSLILAERLAKTSYDPEIDSHVRLLSSLWNNIVNAEATSDQKSSQHSSVISPKHRHVIKNKRDIVSSRWSEIGFQGEDPGTDFRGMGLLALQQLEYLTRKPRNLSIDLIKRSLNKQHEYPWAIVGINITYNLHCLFRDGSMKHFYYDDGELLFRNKEIGNIELLKVINDLYVELFLRFDCFWFESKPENIFAFRELMAKFVDIIKLDLCNRNFAFKFIY